MAMVTRVATLARGLLRGGAASSSGISRGAADKVVEAWTGSGIVVGAGRER